MEGHGEEADRTSEVKTPTFGYSSGLLNLTSRDSHATTQPRSPRSLKAASPRRSNNSSATTCKQLKQRNRNSKKIKTRTKTKSATPPCCRVSFTERLRWSDIVNKTFPYTHSVITLTLATTHHIVRTTHNEVNTAQTQAQSTDTAQHRHRTQHRHTVNIAQTHSQ